MERGLTMCTLLVGGLLPVLCSPAASQKASEALAGEKAAALDDMVVVAQNGRSRASEHISPARRRRFRGSS